MIFIVQKTEKMTHYCARIVQRAQKWAQKWAQNSETINKYSI